MKIELYLMQNDKEGLLIKDFLLRNNLKFHEILTEDIDLLSKVCRTKLNNKISIIRIKNPHNIHIIRGFNEFALNQLIKHIKKYNPKII